MPEKVELLYNDIKKDYEVGSLDDFKKYLDDPIKREKFYNEIVKPNYEVETLDEFENVYGLKKKNLLFLLQALKQFLSVLRSHFKKVE